MTKRTKARNDKEQIDRKATRNITPIPRAVLWLVITMVRARTGWLKPKLLPMLISMLLRDDRIGFHYEHAVQ
jgi:hypothetical protein